MHVAVAIVGFRNPGDIVRCLTALGRSHYADFEVVICENGGADAWAALQAALPRALPGGQPVRAVLAERNLGYAGGVNLCLRTAPDADAWWVLNPDTCPEPEVLRALVRRLAAGDCDAVGCTVWLPDGRVQSHGGLWRPWLARAVSIGHGSAWADAVDEAAIERRQNYLNGASMLVGRRFVETVGPMAEEYFLYCEEVEWCLRGVARGLRLGFANGAPVMHFQGTTTGNEADVRQRGRMPVYLDERNKILLTRDIYPLRLPIAAAAAFAQLVVRFGKRRAWRQLGYAAQGWLAGVLNRRGVPPWLEGAANGGQSERNE